MSLLKVEKNKKKHFTHKIIHSNLLAGFSDEEEFFFEKNKEKALDAKGTISLKAILRNKENKKVRFMMIVNVHLYNINWNGMQTVSKCEAFIKF